MTLPMKTNSRSKPKTENQAESHAGVLKPIQPHAGEFFEFGGQKLLLHGTSGLPKERSRIAEGQPIRHDISLAGRTIPAEATPGAGQVVTRVASGQPAQLRPIAGLTGSGQLIGGPIRRA